MPFQTTYDAYIPSKIEDLLTIVKPEYVSFDTIRSAPADPAHKASYDYAKKIVMPATFIHSIRCYYFALAILYNGFPSNTPGVPQITFDELNKRLYHACILHDLGLTRHPEALQHPAHAMTFEFHGGIMAYDHLHVIDQALNAEQVGDIVQGIMLHTLPFTTGNTSAVGILLQVSAYFDMVGFDALGPHSLDSLLNRKTVQEIEKVYPREGLASEALENINGMLEKKPGCLMTHAPPGFAERSAAIKSLVPEDE